MEQKERGVRIGQAWRWLSGTLSRAPWPGGAGVTAPEGAGLHVGNATYRGGCWEAASWHLAPGTGCPRTRVPGPFPPSGAGDSGFCAKGVSLVTLPTWLRSRPGYDL